MRRGWQLLILPLALWSAGCTLLETATHVMVYRTTEAIEEYHERKRNAAWAERAWAELCQQTPQLVSADYAAGFKEGFAEYLYRGGLGEPPPLPPEHYRKLRYQTPEGFRAIVAWCAGYRHGASHARGGGYRRFVTGPASTSGHLESVGPDLGYPEAPPVIQPVQPSPHELPPPNVLRGGVPNNGHTRNIRVKLPPAEREDP
jgi:hypothetical protein